MADSQQNVPNEYRPLLCPKILADSTNSHVVWARVRGYPSWPAQVLSDTAAQKKLSKVNHKKDIDVPVMFFGTLEIAWINKADIVPFTDGIHKGFLAKGKQKNFQKAIEQVMEFLAVDRKRKAPQYWWCKAPNGGSTSTTPINKTASLLKPLKVTAVGMQRKEEGRDRESSSSSSGDEDDDEEVGIRVRDSSEEEVSSSDALDCMDNKVRSHALGGSSSDSEEAQTPKVAARKDIKEGAAGSKLPPVKADGDTGRKRTGPPLHDKLVRDRAGAVKVSKAEHLPSNRPGQLQGAAAKNKDAGIGSGITAAKNKVTIAFAAAATIAPNGHTKGSSAKKVKLEVEVLPNDAKKLTAPGPTAVMEAAFDADDVSRLPIEIRRLAGIKLAKRQVPAAAAAAAAAVGAMQRTSSAPSQLELIGQGSSILSPASTCTAGEKGDAATPGSLRRPAGILAAHKSLGECVKVEDVGRPKGKLGDDGSKGDSPVSDLDLDLDAVMAVDDQLKVVVTPVPNRTAAASSRQMADGKLLHVELRRLQQSSSDAGAQGGHGFRASPLFSDSRILRDRKEGLLPSPSAAPKSAVSAEKKPKDGKIKPKQAAETSADAAASPAATVKQQPSGSTKEGGGPFSREEMLRRKRERERERREAERKRIKQEEKDQDKVISQGPPASGEQSLEQDLKDVPLRSNARPFSRIKPSIERLRGSSEDMEESSSQGVAEASSDSSEDRAQIGRNFTSTASRGFLLPVRTVGPSTAVRPIYMVDPSSKPSPYPVCVFEEPVPLQDNMSDLNLAPRLASAQSPLKLLQQHCSGPRVSRGGASFSPSSSRLMVRGHPAVSTGGPAARTFFARASASSVEDGTDAEAVEALQLMGRLGVGEDAGVSGRNLFSPMNVASLPNLSSGPSVGSVDSVLEGPQELHKHGLTSFTWPQGEILLLDSTDAFMPPGDWLQVPFPQYEFVKRNVWVSRKRPPRLHKEDISICACSPPEVECDVNGIPRIVSGGRMEGSCLNRMSFIHCDPRSCPCGELCTNRPFHVLPTPLMQTFLTENRGHGVRALQSVRKGSFIMEYSGEVLDSLELEFRMAEARRIGEQHFYIMELDSGLFVDARWKGNAARLLNSSCDPNCETQKWHDAASGEPRIGIFARRDIRPGEELTYDYFFEHYGNLAQSAASFMCMCGAKNCRGTMDIQPEKRRDLGRRLELLWEDDNVFYRGTIVGFNPATRKHVVLYDDGDKERVCLSEVAHRWLDATDNVIGDVEGGSAQKGLDDLIAGLNVDPLGCGGSVPPDTAGPCQRDADGDEGERPRNGYKIKGRVRSGIMGRHNPVSGSGGEEEADERERRRHHSQTHCWEGSRGDNMASLLQAVQAIQDSSEDVDAEPEPYDDPDDPDAMEEDLYSRPNHRRKPRKNDNHHGRSYQASGRAASVPLGSRHVLSGKSKSWRKESPPPPDLSHRFNGSQPHVQESNHAVSTHHHLALHSDDGMASYHSAPPTVNRGGVAPRLKLKLEEILGIRLAPCSVPLFQSAPNEAAHTNSSLSHQAPLQQHRGHTNSSLSHQAPLQQHQGHSNGLSNGVYCHEPQPVLRPPPNLGRNAEAGVLPVGLSMMMMPLAAINGNAQPSTASEVSSAPTAAVASTTSSQQGKSSPQETVLSGGGSVPFPVCISLGYGITSSRPYTPSPLGPSGSMYHISGNCSSFFNGPAAGGLCHNMFLPHVSPSSMNMGGTLGLVMSSPVLASMPASQMSTLSLFKAFKHG